jgi:2-dehydro-3-deoxyphosphooctonate aldolase (KDO 8-P synthase)
VKVIRVDAGGVVFGGDTLAVIAGPCVIENAESCLRHAGRLARIARETGVPIVFKSSFDKANRTSHSSFRGPGLHGGIEVLARVRRETGLPVLTDIHEPQQAAIVAEVADILQVPALLSRQTDLVMAAAATGRAINI